MNNKFILLGAVVAAMLTSGCGTKKEAVGSEENPLLPLPVSHEGRGHIIGSEERIAGKAVNHLPKGVVYRMSGNYADNVPITLTPQGTLQSYPAPTDLCAESTPVQLYGGWWLDRRGVSSRTVFTRYTYSEYAAMPSAPSPQQLIEAVIPGAKVTAVIQLPMTMQEAVADTAAVNEWIRMEIRSKK